MIKRIIALDVGDRRIGIAVSDPLGITAQPVETYTRVGYGPDVRRIVQLASQYETDQILCGLPKNMDGTQGFQTEKVREFASKLTEAGMCVSFYDERMTTMLAENALLEGDVSREGRKKKVDMVAAVIILQYYLDSQAIAAAQADESDDEEYDDDGILEMEDEDGNVIRLSLTAEIRYADEDYVLLTCLEDSGDLSGDESIVMKVISDDKGVSCYQMLEDDALIAAVYEAYLAQSEGF